MTEERKTWLQWRKGGIGSSDAPIIMGVSPWCTPLGLYEEKLSPVTEESEAQGYFLQRGNEVEPAVRALYEVMEGESFSPALVQNGDFPWIRASLDGRSEDQKRIIEIKLSGREDWELARTGKVPEKYWPQVQHQLMVSGAECCKFLSYLYDKEDRNIRAANLTEVTVRPDSEYIAKLVEMEDAFWTCVRTKTAPKPTARDYKRLTGAATLAAKWVKLKEKIEKQNGELESLRKQIIALADAEGHPRFTAGKMRMRKTARVGNVQYAKIPELMGVDLEQYRGKGSISWTLEAYEEAE